MVLGMSGFGSDPELFVLREGGRKPISAHTLDFTEYKSKSTGAGDCTVKLDGFAVELNPSAASCRDYQVPTMGQALKDFYKKHKGYVLSAVPVQELLAESLVNAPEDVLGYGCVPDRNAYTLTEKTPPTTGYPDRFRYTGGHIHWSLGGFPGKGHTRALNTTRNNYEPPSQEIQELFAAYMAMFADVYLAVPFVSVLGTVNDYGEARRRQFYGQPGSHRVKEYGFEYRVLSSAIMLSPILYTWVIGQFRYATNHHAKLRSLVGGYRPGAGWNYCSPKEIVAYVESLNKDFDFDRVRSIITNHDVQEARAFMESHKMYDSMYGANFVRLAERADSEGIAFNTNMYQSWKLGSSIRDHAYIGVEGAMANTWDDPLVFPQHKLTAEFSRTSRWSF